MNPRKNTLARRRSVMSFLSLTAGVMLVFAAAAPATASPTTDYDDYPAAAPSYPSLGYEATATSEFGDKVTLGGSARVLDNVTVSFTDWACGSDYTLTAGAWTTGPGGACTTTPASTFSHPITVNIYAVDATVSPEVPGALLATVTEAVDVPFRPSASTPACTANKWYDATTATCNNGFAFDWTFDLSAGNITLPDDIIIAVAFNTQNYGAAPLGVGGPYNSLNVTANDGAPTVGTNDDPDIAYLSSTSAGSYNGGVAAGTGTLRADTGWSTNNPVFRISATTPAATSSAKSAASGKATLASTGVDTAAMTAGGWVGGGVLALGAILFGIAAYLRKRIARR